MLGLMLLACVAPGCITKRSDVYSFEWETIVPAGAEESAPLGGEALAQMRYELERARRDMDHYRATFASLEGRGDKDGMLLFSAFLDAYMGMHLDGLLRSEWQSRHPELGGLDANLRIAQLGLLERMHDSRRMLEVMREIEERFALNEDFTCALGLPKDCVAPLLQAKEHTRVIVMDEVLHIREAQLVGVEARK